MWLGVGDFSCKGNKASTSTNVHNRLHLERWMGDNCDTIEARRKAVVWNGEMANMPLHTN